MASAQDFHEILLQSQTSTQTLGARLRRGVSLARELAQALAGDSLVRDNLGTDVKALVIENYLKDWGHERVRSAIKLLPLPVSSLLKAMGLGGD